MTADYQERFSGIGRLWGAGAMERLAAAHAAVIGVGGVGSWAVEALVRSGVGAVTLIDLDDVCVTNVNRQLPALDGTVGRPKVDVLAERMRLINPASHIHAVAEFFTPASADRLLQPAFDVVIDAVDRMSVKALIISGCVARGLGCVTCGSAGGKRDATQIRVDDLGRAGSDELLRQTRKRLRKEHGFAHGEGVRFGVSAVFSPEPLVFPWADGTCRTEAEPGSALRMDCASGYGAATFVTGTFGFVAAGEAVRLIVEGRKVS